MILLPIEPERRKGERRSVDDHGAYTVEVDGKVVIRPRSDTADMLEQYIALHSSDARRFTGALPPGFGDSVL